MSKKKFYPSGSLKHEDSLYLKDAPNRDIGAVMIPTSQLKIGSNPRLELADSKELKDSIAEHGVLNALLVYQSTDGIEVIGGHRRLQCALELGLPEVPCRVITSSQPDLIKLIDNLVRQQLDPVSEFRAIKNLLPMFDNNQSALARAISKSPSYVNRAIRAAKMIDEAGSLCASAQPLSKTSLMELADCSDPKTVLLSAKDGRKESIRRARGKTDQVQAGKDGPRTVAGSSIRYNETRLGWKLNIVWSSDSATKELKLQIMERMENLVQSLRENR